MQQKRSQTFQRKPTEHPLCATEQRSHAGRGWRGLSEPLPRSGKGELRAPKEVTLGGSRLA